jgi:hypothetical protein
VEPDGLWPEELAAAAAAAPLRSPQDALPSDFRRAELVEAAHLAASGPVAAKAFALGQQYRLREL